MNLSSKENFKTFSENWKYDGTPEQALFFQPKKLSVKLLLLLHFFCMKKKQEEEERGETSNLKIKMF